ncbi:MAG: hypothetical protein IJ575_11005 [Selenomonadaceae bacterium]|nr:hypothetical protein [Selenomonadaceae bacterium]
MRKILLILTMIFAMSIQISEAAETPIVAVMDLGTHPGAVPIDINILNAGRVASDYTVEKLLDDNQFIVMERTIIDEQLEEENLKYEGIIDPDTAQRIGKMLGAKYLIYGNVNDVTLSDVGTQVLTSGVTVCTVGSHVILRMMDVETGAIVSMSKGEGKSKSSFTQIGSPMYMITVGTKTVTQDSVHNAIQKAAYQATEILVDRMLNGVSKSNDKSKDKSKRKKS